MSRNSLPRFYIVVFTLLSFSSFGQQGFHEGLKAEKSGALWGFKNTHNKWAITPQYDTVYHFFEFGKAIVGKNQRYGVIDLNGKIIIPFVYDEILPEYKHLFPVKNKEGKWGFLYHTGKEVFPMQYDNFRYEYRDKYLLLQENGKWGIYSPSTLEIVKPTYKQIFHQQQKTYKVLPFAWNEIASSSGAVLQTVEGDGLELLSNNTYSYSIVSKKGICNAQGKLCDAIFEDVKYAHDTLFFGKKNGVWNIVSMKGEVLSPLSWENLHIEKDYFIGQLNKEEKQIYTWPLKAISSSTFKEIASHQNSTWIVKNKFNLWGVINDKGEQLISYRYDTILPFKKGYAEAKLQGEKVIITESGELLVNSIDYPYYNAGILKINGQGQKIWMKEHEQYINIVQLSYKYYRVQKEKKQSIGIVDEQGSVILPCQYDAIHLSSDNTTFITRQGLKYTLFDHTGKWISGPHKRFEDVVDVSEGLIKVKYKGALGFCDFEGRIMISTQYEETGVFKNGICPVKLRGLWGYINKDEQIVLQPYYQAPALFYGESGVIKENNSYHLINNKGKITLEYPLRSVTRTPDGFYIIENKEGLFGLANHLGKEIIAAKYQKIIRCENGLFIVSNENYSGAIDLNGRIIIPVKYNRLSYSSTLDRFCGTIERDWTLLTIK